MEDPYEDRSMPADLSGDNYDHDDLMDFENMRPPQVDYYAVLNLSKTVNSPPLPDEDPTLWTGSAQ
jgi:DnaJ family protein C protein 11